MVDEHAKRPVFGALLRARRIAAGFTQDDLAERAGISVQAVSSLERGTRSAPRGDTLALLAEALELDRDALSEFEAAARTSVKPRIRSTQPLLKKASSKRAHLPQFGTPFVGRDGASHDLAAALLHGGCTTLWGTGGVGKTRLAVETSALVEERFERIAFVGLAATIGDDTVDDAIASALGIVRAPGEDLFTRIVAELSERRWLVIVDNCEHVVAGAARSVDALVTVLPKSTFVCTSREPLRIRGERVIPVGALDASDAHRLFVDLAATGATLSDTDERDVATICRKLDGIPLALELAAACARVLDLEHVVSGLDERFRLLTRGSRAATDRHTTLRATIAWSYDMLDAPDRTVFERAAIFNGSFSLEELLAIAVDEDCDRAAVFEATTALVEKSLLVVETDIDTSRRRYGLLDSTRAFALEAAEERDGAAALREPHRRWGHDLANRLRRSIDDYRSGGALPLGDVRLDHIRGYLDWAIEKRNDVAFGTQLAGEIHLVWDICGLPVEGIRRIETGLRFLSDDDADASAAMHGWYAVSRLNQRLVRNAESLAPGLKSYELASRFGDDVIRASAAARLAVAYDALGERTEALAYANEARVAFERIGDRQSAAYNACTAARIAFKIRGDDAALEALRAAVEGQRLAGDDRRTAAVTMDLGEAYFERGDVEAAIASMHAAIEQFRKTSSRLELAIGLNNLGAYLTSCGRAAEAIPVALEALHIGREGRTTRMIVLAAQTCATAAAIEGRHERHCVEVFGFVARRYETIGEIGFTERSAHETLRSFTRDLLPAAEHADALRAGAAFDDAAAIVAALRCIDAQGPTATPAT